MIETTQTFKNVRLGLALPDGDMNVFTGPNNSGKSAILQYLNMYGPSRATSDYISPRRFDLSNQVSIALNADEELKGLWNQRKTWNDQMAEITAPDAIRELVSLPDEARERITDWHNSYFGELKIEPFNPANRYSPPRITIDGRLATQQGSGSRSVLAVLCSLLHPDRDTILIDEPEIGIEPQVQKKLSRLIHSVSRGDEGLPKKRVYIATHSHIFLDRSTLTNNYVVTKAPDGFGNVRRIETPQEMHSLIFNLLGNSPEDLFFPDNVLVVEGVSDQLFMRRLLELSGAGGVAVHFADGDGKVGAALPAIDQMLKTLAYVPWYRERICVLVDSSVSTQSLDEWKRFLSDDGTRVRQLLRNGIEYYYPTSLMCELAEIAANDVENTVSAFLSAIHLGARSAALGAFSGTKRQLAEAVVERLSGAHLATLSEEINSALDSVSSARFSVGPAAL